MTYRSLVLIGASLALAACEQADPKLPFESEPAAPVARTVPAAGGSLSSGAGAALAFPAGALAAGTEVTLTPTPARAPGGSGQVAASHSFELSPAGLRLQKPATAELKLATSDARAWQAALVVSSPSGLYEIGAADVDLTSGLLRAPIPVLGTITAVIPDPAAVVSVRSGGAARSAIPVSNGTLAAAASRAVYDAGCGAPGARCGIVVNAPRGLPASITDAVLVYPSITGRIVVDGAAASGTLRLTGSGRFKIGNTATPVDVEIVATADGARAVAGAAGVTLEGVRVHGVAGDETTDQVLTLQIRHTDQGAELVVVESLEIRVGNETYPITITIPLARS
jgi:hypothetical protein